MIECLLDLVVLKTLLHQNYQGMSLNMLRKRQALWVYHPVTLQFDSCLAIAYVIVNGSRLINDDLESPLMVIPDSCKYLESPGD